MLRAWGQLVLAGVRPDQVVEEAKGNLAHPSRINIDDDLAASILGYHAEANVMALPASRSDCKPIQELGIALFADLPSLAKLGSPALQFMLPAKSWWRFLS